jgi:hypothetical protein
VVVVTSLVSTSARAEERAAAAWQLDVKAAYVVLGAHAARATGGIMPSLTGWRIGSVGEAVDIGVGADAGLFGLEGVGKKAAPGRARARARARGPCLNPGPLKRKPCRCS